MKKITILKKFEFKKRHIVWNCEISPTSFFEGALVRYHFIIVDDKFRESKLKNILGKFEKNSGVSYPLEKIREKEGKFKATSFRYLFASFDAVYPPNFLDFKGISCNIKKDPNLLERKRGSIEDYVSNIYE